MDGFKSNTKMKSDMPCYKEGGHINIMKKGGKAKHHKEGGDIAQDKALIKKAFKQHDEAEHKKEPTEIKLKKGGRDKKKEGTVKKYKAGGAIEMHKKSGDLDEIKKIKATGNKKADAKSAALKKGGKAMCSGGKYKKGGSVEPSTEPSTEKKVEAKKGGKIGKYSAGSDVEKEKSKPAGDVDKINKVPPTGDKKANAESAGAKPKASDFFKKGGHASKKAKAGGHKKHMADGSLTGALDANNPAPYNPASGIPPQTLQQMLQAQAYAKQQRMNGIPAMQRPQMQQPTPGILPTGRTGGINPTANGGCFGPGFVMKKGGHVKHMADGSLTSPLNPAQQAALLRAQASTNAAQQAVRRANAAGLGGGQSLKPIQGQGPYSDAEINAALAQIAKRGGFSHTGD